MTVPPRPPLSVWARERLGNLRIVASVSSNTPAADTAHAAFRVDKPLSKIGTAAIELKEPSGATEPREFPWDAGFFLGDVCRRIAGRTDPGMRSQVRVLLRAASSRSAMSQLLNRSIAGHLEDAAEILRHEGADPQHVHAYTLAASSVRHWPISMAVMYRHRGVEGLEEVPGVGPRIAGVIRELLTHHRLPPRGALLDLENGAATGGRSRQPSVEELLDIDREYRAKAAAGELPLIAPQRFNPSGDGWLPVLHTHRGPRRYTALYSNTERAHRLGRSRDWVVLYAQDATRADQYTIVTSSYGVLRGRRVVAGRERQCRAAEQRAA